jgi:hypothetical protein
MARLFSGVDILKIEIEKEIRHGPRRRVAIKKVRLRADLFPWTVILSISQSGTETPLTAAGI